MLLYYQVTWYAWNYEIEIDASRWIFFVHFLTGVVAVAPVLNVVGLVVARSSRSSW